MVSALSPCTLRYLKRVTCLFFTQDSFVKPNTFSINPCTLLNQYLLQKLVDSLKLQVGVNYFNFIASFISSLSVSGSSIKGYSSTSPTAILSNPATASTYGLHVRGLNKGIRIDRQNSTNASAHTSIIHHSNDFTYITQNIGG